MRFYGGGGRVELDCCKAGDESGVQILLTEIQGKCGFCVCVGAGRRSGLGAQALCFDLLTPRLLVALHSLFVLLHNASHANAPIKYCCVSLAFGGITRCHP